jgi:hypothetical protein
MYYACWDGALLAGWAAAVNVIRYGVCLHLLLCSGRRLWAMFGEMLSQKNIDHNFVLTMVLRRL